MAVTERQRANLRPFPKGTSGNPGGQPKGLSTEGITTLVRRLIEENPKGSKKTHKELIARTIIEKMEAGDARILSDFLDRAEGAAPLKVLSDQKIVIEIVVVKAENPVSGASESDRDGGASEVAK